MKLVRNSVLGLSLLLLPVASHAYIGPGAGLGAIGSAIALLGALILLIVGFVWYPLKRLLRRRKAAEAALEGDEVVTARNEDEDNVNAVKEAEKV